MADSAQELGPGTMCFCGMTSGSLICGVGGCDIVDLIEKCSGGVSKEREFCNRPSEEVRDVVYCSLLEVAQEIN